MIQAEDAIMAWRVNISLPRRVLHRLDACARSAGETRPGFIARMAVEGRERAHVSNVPRARGACQLRTYTAYLDCVPLCGARQAALRERVTSGGNNDE